MRQPKFTRWKAYIKANTVANSISKMVISCFPSHEKYVLADQIRRSSRSVGANLAEAAGKDGYPKYFFAKIADAKSENYETQHWILCACSEGYIDHITRDKYLEATNEVGRLLSYMPKNINQFIRTDKVSA